jgi:succinoglycan biosynthesis protein ExoO
MANYNGERHLADALTAVLAQSLTNLEVLLIDDASSDRSVAIAEAMAMHDQRLRIQRLASNSGPAAARNHGLAAARGKWIAVVDSDDMIHPQRLQRLVDTAEDSDADIIADDLLEFYDDHRVPPRRLLRGKLALAPSWITTAQYIRSNRLCAREMPLGYLKPLIRASFLAEQRIQYDESMQIAEDYDLILHLLARGARYRLVPELLYFYRRHNASISYRLSASALTSMALADARFRLWAGEQTVAPLRPALDARLASIHAVAASEVAIAHLKARSPLAALAAMAARPSAVPIVARLATPARLLARLRRRKPIADSGTVPGPRRPVVCVLSRQRLAVGSTGSAAYLLSLCRSLRESGFALHLVCPSPAMLGRVPALRIAGDGDVFDHVAVRGTRRIGNMLVARDPRVFFHAAIGIADRLARRIGITTLSAIAQPAPYAVGLPWTAEDFLYVAAQARNDTDFVLADYAFLTPGIPYVLQPAARSAVVMHDLFSARPEAFAQLGATDSVTTLSEPVEADLLARADLVIAIQHHEAEAARRLLPPGHAVVVAPMALEPVKAAQPGEGGGLLFVGSVAAANVDGMRWFLAEIWPLLRARLPNLHLAVAGTVCTALGSTPRHPGVTLLGRVADLSSLYRRADVVISPLRTGSGLKIKLVEALAHGKPMVATTTTAQGVEHLLGGVVALADTAQDFAAQVLTLLAQPMERTVRAEAALAVARRCFSVETAYAPVIDHLRMKQVTTVEAISCAA